MVRKTELRGVGQRRMKKKKKRSIFFHEIKSEL